MRVKVYNNYANDQEDFEGTPDEIKQKLVTKYTWLPADVDLPVLLEELDSQQAYTVDADGAETPVPMVKSESPSNFMPDKDDLAFEAVRWLTQGQVLSEEAQHRALWREDADPVRAALVAYAQEPTPEAIKTVRAWMDMAEKNPSSRVEEEVPAQAVAPKVPADGQAAADAVRRAFDAAHVFKVALGGKHSAGSMLARDPEGGKTLLLKPAAGGQSAAAGAAEDLSTQPQREAAAWHLAEEWGLGQYLPRADLLLVGEIEVAAIEMLQKPFTLLEDIDQQSPGIARMFLKKYLAGGTLHRWGFFDYVIGNPDRHARNMMADPKGSVRLIDEGSAFAGEKFDPARDRNSFVPFYLRAWAPRHFNSAPLSSKTKWMPRLGQADERELRMWAAGLSGEKLRTTLLRYGVAARVCLDRFQRLQELIKSMPVDMAVNVAWIGS